MGENTNGAPLLDSLPGADGNGPKTLFEPIAVIGMGMRLPGRVHNAADYWDLLVNGKSGRCRVPKTRYNVDTWYGPGRASHVPSEFGYFLDELNLAHIDPSFWSFTKQEAELMDPRQRLFLEVAYEALESSGSKNSRGKDVGVYVGTMGDDWNLIESRDEQNLNQVRPDVYGDYIIANRTSYEFDLTGPSLVVRTACSASLVALHLACRDLHSGDCSSALVGGVNLILTPKDTAIMHQQGVLSASASCKSFDAGADGFARGEGVSAIYIKKLADAVRDGDPVRAVIRSTCVAGNGRTHGLTTPNPEIHERLMRRGHMLAGITDLSKTAMVECHGTGTQVGDPLEVGAIANIWGDHGIYIGSVKPNIGHGEGASGLSSLIKMVLALENSTIPPNINFKTPNPRIPWDKAKLKVPTEPLPWPTDRLERVSVNSFGIGGSNAHVLLESASCFGVPIAQLTNGVKPESLTHRIVALSAKHPDSVKALGHEIKTYLDRQPERLNDVAYSLAACRETHAYRAFCVTDGNGTLQLSHTSKAATATPRLVWIFTGQGAQWAQMGKELLEQEPFFQKRINALDDVLAELPNRPPWTLTDLLLAPKDVSRLGEAEFSQPCLVAIQVALVDLLRSWGVSPTAVVGHSSGETAAAYASGAITAEEAILIAYHRGQITLLIKAAHKGSMAAVGLGRRQVERFLRPGVIIGCENSPSNVTLSGDIDVLEEILREIRSAFPDVLARSLRVECGYHSHHMRAAADDFMSRLQNLIHPKDPTIPFYSSVTGEIATDLSPSYWVKNVISPVIFSTAVQRLLDDFNAPTFIEIGPHSALAGPVRQILQQKNRTAQYIPTLVRNEHAVAAVLKTAGDLWLAGTDIDLGSVVPSGKFLTDLPTYQWHYDEEFWLETRLSRNWRMRKFDHHEILGTRVEEISDACPAWRCKLRLEDVPWLRDHVVLGDIVFPAAGYITMVGEALRQLKGTVDFTLSHVSLEAALVLSDSSVELVTVLNPAKRNSSLEPGWYDFSVSSLNEGSETWVSHISGRCRAGSEFERLGPDAQPFPRKVSTSSFYSTWKRFGLNYGTSFRNLANVSSHVTDLKAAATLEKSLPSQEVSVYSIHPATLDSSMHLAMISACRGLEKNFRQLAVPTYIEEVYVSKPKGKVEVVGRTDVNGQGKSISNITGISNGEVVIDICGLEVSSFSDNSDGSEDDPHAGCILEWKPDVDFTDISKLIRRLPVAPCISSLDELVLACNVDLRSQLQFLPATQPHLINFKSWVDASYRQAMTGQYPEVLNSFDLATMSYNTRDELIFRILLSCRGTASKDVAVAIHRVHTFASAYFSGSAHAVKTLQSEDHLTGIQELLRDVDFSDFLKLLAHKKPSMRILHIGASTEGDVISSTLFSSNESDRMFGSFVYTGTTNKASKADQKRIGAFQGVEYKQLCIESDPASQGFVEESFDLIISEPTLVPVSVPAMQNIRRLLKPRGHLILQHSNPESRVLRFVSGITLESAFESEGLTQQARLRKNLDQAGFDGSAAFTFSGEHGGLTIATPYADHSIPKKISILCQDPSHSKVADVARSLKSRGSNVQFFAPGQELPWGQPVLSLLDIEEPFFHSMTPAQWDSIKLSLISAQDAKTLWATGASQVGCKDPNYSMTLGVARSIRRELSMDLITLELESFDSEGWNAIATVLGTFGDRFKGGEFEPDFEYVFHHGSLQISRFHSVKVSDELREKSQNAPIRLKVTRLGASPNFRWEETTHGPLDGDCIEVQVKAAGLNTHELDVSLDFAARGDAQFVEFGSEGSGIVRAVGPGARRLRVGDRVAFSHQGSVSTSVTLSETLCAEIPASMSFEEAASTPHTYGTVLHGLMELGKLSRDQTILIHSASSALGLAAIQLAKTIGANIFCTVKTPDEIRFLTTSYGVPENTILTCENTSYLPAILRLTGNRGVDLVFSTGSDPFRHTSWRCLAPFGTVVEVGSKGSSDGPHLPLDATSRSRTYIRLDLNELRIHRPLECTRPLNHSPTANGKPLSLLEQAFTFCKLGLNKPAQPIKTFPAADVSSAVSHLRSGNCIGRVVITLPKSSSELRALPQRPQITLRADRTYVLVGGLGGLGQATGRFLAEKGARDLIFFSRSAEEFASSNPDYFNELKALGCTTRAVSGSVDLMADVVKMADSATTPIAGVLQAAMVLRDVSFADMTFEQWQATVNPKVQGTWNIHYALQAQKEPLDFFFLFSSLSGLGGQIGQVNYAAGNAFLDAFVQFRHSKGLACSVLDIGIMEDIGVLARETVRLEALRATTQHCLHEQEFLDALELMIRRSRPDPIAAQLSKTSPVSGYINHSQVAIGMGSPSSKRAGWQRDPRVGFMASRTSEDEEAARESNGRTLKEFIQGCSMDPSVLALAESREFLAREIGAALQGFTMRSDAGVDLSLPLQTDSLVTVELRHWFRQKMGVTFTLLEMKSAESILALGGMTAARLFAVLSAGTQGLL
ncbi:Lovastatin diketide synthase LovF 1 [Colletotrichum chlorophyti]|uniref:Lovastatin diketide synthase LovF 1 n=1 Tax=Colletotrichum chlorophyti TaxID=708187 RepID=A0A1Q8S7N7_9PEZI|nr:Lovastatin diketide synthase LovF 1 [Colletotrichum chlorophyti]